MHRQPGGQWRGVGKSLLDLSAPPVDLGRCGEAGRNESVRSRPRRGPRHVQDVLTDGDRLDFEPVIREHVAQSGTDRRIVADGASPLPPAVFELTVRGDPRGHVRVPLFGAHNVRNALAAMAAGEPSLPASADSTPRR